MRSIGAVLGVLGACIPTSWGQEQPAELPEPAEDAWTICFEPVLWYGAPGGKVQLPGAPQSAGRLDLTNMELDNPGAIPGGVISLNADPWRFTVAGFRLEDKDQGAISTFSGQVGPVAITTGDPISSSLAFTSFEGSIMRSVALPRSLRGSPGSDFSAALELGVGLRVYDVDFQFTAPAGSTGADRFFIHPLLAAHLQMEIIRQFSAKAVVDIGGFATGGDDVNYGYSIATSFGWRPTDNIQIELGYRDLAYLLQTGAEGSRFEYSGAIQGLFVAVEVRF